MMSSARVLATCRSASTSVWTYCFIVNATSEWPIRWLNAFQSMLASRPFTLRGEIAHRGAPAVGVRKKTATNGLAFVERLAAKSAERVNQHIAGHVSMGFTKSRVLMEGGRFGPAEPLVDGT